MTDGILKHSIAEGKFPVRRGEPTNTTKYVNAWSKLPVGVDRKAHCRIVFWCNN